jgi:hypothetical protein
MPMLDHNEDLRRLQNARNFAHFVMDIVRKNIETGGDERSLYCDLEKAAYDASMQWMPLEAFVRMKAIEKLMLDKVGLQTETLFPPPPTAI